MQFLHNCNLSTPKVKHMRSQHSPKNDRRPQKPGDPSVSKKPLTATHTNSSRRMDSGSPSARAEKPVRIHHAPSAAPNLIIGLLIYSRLHVVEGSVLPVRERRVGMPSYSTPEQRHSLEITACLLGTPRRGTYRNRLDHRVLPMLISREYCKPVVGSAGPSRRTAQV